MHTDIQKHMQSLIFHIISSSQEQNPNFMDTRIQQRIKNAQIQTHALQTKFQSWPGQTGLINPSQGMKW